MFINLIINEYALNKIISFVRNKIGIECSLRNTILAVKKNKNLDNETVRFINHTEELFKEIRK